MKLVACGGGPPAAIFESMFSVWSVSHIQLTAETDSESLSKVLILIFMMMINHRTGPVVGLLDGRLRDGRVFALRSVRDGDFQR